MPRADKSETQGPTKPSDLRTIDIFNDLSDEALAEILPLLRPRVVRQRRALPLKKHFGGHICFGWSGRYRVLAATPSGGSINMSTIERGAVFNHSIVTLGFEPGDQIRLVADLPGLILLLPSGDAQRLIDTSPAFARGFMRALALLNVAFAQRIFEIAALDTRTLLVAELLRLADTGARHGAHVIVQPAPTQNALAAQLGVSREAVSRNLRLLAQEGLVRVERGRLEFPDVKRLSVQAGDASSRSVFKTRQKS